METFLAFVAVLPAIAYCLFWTGLFFGLLFWVAPEFVLLIIGFIAAPFLIIAYIIGAVRDMVVAYLSKSKT